METPLVFEEGNGAALGWSVGMGMMYVIAMIIPVAVIESTYFLSPTAILENALMGIIILHNSWTNYAAYSMEYGSLAIFGTMTVLWLLAYIPNETFANIYISAIPIATYISYGLALWVLTAFILGGVLEESLFITTDTIGWNIGYGLIFTGCMIGLEILVEYMFLGEACAYYEGDQCNMNME